MAAHGYEKERFETPVSKRFHCSYCLHVFKDPVMCRRNQHTFCRGCITSHLENQRRCPVCNDELTLETLTDPPRILTECLSELKIRCEFYERGCHEISALQGLERHVELCGYAVAKCSNEGCDVEVNKRDLIHHEFVECEHRKLRCHNCERLSKDVDELKRSFIAVSRDMEKQLDTTCKNLYAAVEIKLDSFLKNFDFKMKEQQKNMDCTLKALKRNNNSVEDNLKELEKIVETLPKKSRVESDDDDAGSDTTTSDFNAEDYSQIF